MKAVIALVLTAGLSGCVFYPRRIEVYDAQCKITTHKLKLDMVTTNSLNCGSGSVGSCLAVVAAAGTATAVVSGSIVVAGNTLYWLEREGQCTAAKVARAS